MHGPPVISSTNPWIQACLCFAKSWGVRRTNNSSSSSSLSFVCIYKSHIVKIAAKLQLQAVWSSLCSAMSIDKRAWADELILKTVTHSCANFYTSWAELRITEIVPKEPTPNLWFYFGVSPLTGVASQLNRLRTLKQSIETSFKRHRSITATQKTVLVNVSSQWEMAKISLSNSQYLWSLVAKIDFRRIRKILNSQSKLLQKFLVSSRRYFALGRGDNFLTKPFALQKSQLTWWWLLSIMGPSSASSDGAISLKLIIHFV